MKKQDLVRMSPAMEVASLGDIRFRPANLDRRKPYREDERIADGVPGMHDLGAIDDVVPFLRQRDPLHRFTRVKRYVQRAADQDRDRGGIPICPGSRPLLAV